MKNRPIPFVPNGSWFLSWPDPVFIIDNRNLKILGLNVNARRLLAASPLLTQEAGCVAFSDARASDCFRIQIENLRHAPGPTRVKVLAEESDLFAWVDFPQPDARPHMAVLTFRGQLGGKYVSDPRQDWVQVAILMGLTSLEIDVASRLTGSYSEEAIASGLGVSASLLDYCIQKIFAKTGTSSRAELNTHLLSFCHSRIWHWTYRSFLEKLMVAFDIESSSLSYTSKAAVRLQAQEVRRQLAIETLSIANSMDYRLHRLLL